MEEGSGQKINPENEPDHQDEPREGRPSAKDVPERRAEGQKALRWGVWVLIVLIGFLLLSNIANLVVSQRAYESSQKQVKAIEQMTQSIKEMQKSITNLSRMIEQPPAEDEEPEDARGNGVLGADSI